MRKLNRLTMTLALLIMTTGAWAQTANEVTVNPVTGKTNQWTFTMPASNVELQVEYYAESNLFLSKDALADRTSIAVKAGDLGVQFGDDGKSANTITEGTAMTVKYNGTREVKNVTVVKKSAYEHSITIAVDPSTTGAIATAPAMTIEFNTGETWADVAARYDWLGTYETYTVCYKGGKLTGDVHDAKGGVKPADTIDPNGSYHWGM